MAAIDRYTFNAWAGKMPLAVAQYETFRRPGLDGLGVGFDAYVVDPVVITTRAIVTSDKLAGTATGYQALVQKTVTVVDGMGSTYRNVLVIQVRNIAWDQLIQPAGFYLLTAEWVLLQDVNG